MRTGELWKCPECGRRFANEGQWHSCVVVTVDDHLEGRSEHACALYRRFEAMVRAAGPVTLAPAKTRIGFQVRMIFASVNRISDKGLAAHVVLARRLDHRRFSKIQALGGRYVHHFRIHSPDELDDEVQAWLTEAYAVGEQRDLT